MPIHDWTRVEAGIFHAFHHRWITAMTDGLNAGLLPVAYYALPEQYAAGIRPDVLTLPGPGGPAGFPADAAGQGAVVLAEPRVSIRMETEPDFYRRKKAHVAVRHVSDDRLVAVIEIVSRGNKDARAPLQDLLDKTIALLDAKVHLLLVDLFPPGRYDPHGLHAAIWEELAHETFLPPTEKPLTLVAYESAAKVRAHVEPIAVGDELVPMPLFLEPGMHVLVPLDTTYQTSWDALPARWRDVIAPLV